MTNKTPTEAEIVEAMARAIERADFECQADFVTDVGLIEDWSEHCAQAALAAQRAMRLVLTQGWQPIETAPRDGTPIDLWVCFPSKAVRWSNAKWLESGRHSCTGPSNWCSDEGFPLHAFTERPVATHWMPLPAPPIAAAQGGED